MTDVLSVAGITAIVVIVFTVVFQYFPALRILWAGLRGEFKALTVLGLYLAIGAIVAFGGCVPALLALIPGLLCSQGAPFISYAIGVLFAVGAGQGVFQLMPELKDVAAAKAARS